MNCYFEQHDKIINNQTLVILLIDLAKQRGIHPDKLLKGTKLFYQDLTLLSFRISHQQFVKLIQNALKLIQSPDIAFLIGSRLFPAQLGQIGSALMNTKSLLDMLRIIKCYQMHVFPFMFVIQRRHKGQCYLFFNHAISTENKQYQIFMCELLSSIIVSAIKWRMTILPTLSIRFPYQKPDHVEQYQAYFSGMYRFNPNENEKDNNAAKSHPCLQISIGQTELIKPLPAGNQVIKRHYLHQLENRALCVGIVQYVLQLIASYFKNNQDISLEKLAEKFNISPSTFKRKLAAHNTSYQYLLDTFRQQQAIFQLTEQGDSNEKVAKALNFSDITNFRRSFKRWTGLTPNDLKEKFLRHNIYDNHSS
jgi:AraC-like DNA-binding protein